MPGGDILRDIPILGECCMGCNDFAAGLSKS